MDIYIVDALKSKICLRALLYFFTTKQYF